MTYTTKFFTFTYKMILSVKVKLLSIKFMSVKFIMTKFLSRKIVTKI